MEHGATLKFRKALCDMLECIVEAMNEKETTAKEPEEQPEEPYTAEDVVMELKAYLEDALSEGRVCGYNQDFNEKANPQENFDRGQFHAYKKIAEHLDILVGQID